MKKELKWFSKYFSRVKVGGCAYAWPMLSLEAYLENGLYLGREELAKTLGISLSSVDRQMRAKKFPFTLRMKIGRRVVFPRTILQKLEEQTACQ